MNVELGTFVAGLMSDPLMLAVTLLNIGVIVVNGATDAPNAIATVVSTRSMKPRPAIVMAAVCNFLGLLVVSLFTSAVANTIFKMVDFGGDNQAALAALAAAMVAIIVWGAAAWFFGIPTSQSHSLIAGLTGAAIAAVGSFDAINWNEWMKVIYGILLSTFLGFGMGWLTARLIARLCRRAPRNKANQVFHWGQI
ncbi:MAG: anion permease, partial [Eggerthellaceae bacterium]